MSFARLRAEWFPNIRADILAGTVVALALIPEVLNRLTIRAAESDAKRAAKELAAMRKKIELFEGSVKGLEAAKTKADADAKRAKDDADALVSTAEKKAAADIAAAKKDADAAKKLADAEAKKKVDAAEADLASSMMKHTEELKRLQESFAGRLAEARKGGVLQITPAEVLTQDRAARDYNAGVRAYRAENFPKALASLESAVKLDPVDARYWYYLGLAQFELGKKADAEASFKKGSDLEIRSQPSSKLVGEALERVQGAARKDLGEFR